MAVATVPLGLLVACSSPATPAPAPVGSSSSVGQAAEPAPIIGAWRVAVKGAPYGPHLFQFLPGGVLNTTNPTGVQEVPDGSGTHDSVGFGAWKQASPTDPNQVSFTFVQLNATQITTKHPKPRPAEELVVTCRAKVDQETAFVANCQATLVPAGKAVDLTKMLEATLTGTRIVVEEPMLDRVKPVA